MIRLSGMAPGLTIRYRNHLVSGVILLLTFLCYLPVFQNGFVWDDDSYIVNNPIVRNFALYDILTGNVMGNYHPVTMLVLAAEYLFFGLNPAGYHTVNLLLHLLNVILVFYAVTLLSDRPEAGWVAALMFGIHPLHVESVAWVAALKDLLYTFFFLSALIFYLKYLGNYRRKFYFFSLLCFLISLLSKAMAASLPVVLLLTDYFKGRKMDKNVWLEKIPFLILSVILGIIAVFEQNARGSIQEFTYPLMQRIGFAGYGFVTYLIKFLFPHHLSAFYPYPGKHANPGELIIYIILVLGITGYVLYSRLFTRKLLFGFGFFAVTIFLVLQLLPVGKAVMADRYSYLSSVGIFYLAGEGFYHLWTQRSKWLTVFILGIFTVFFSVRTFGRCTVWKDELHLWNDVISKYDNVPLAYLNRGIYYAKENNYDQAIEDLSKAIQLDTNYNKAYFNYAKAFYNRGNMYAGKHQNDLALKDFNKCIEINPGYVSAYFNRGNIHSDLEEYDRALSDFSTVIALNPRDTKAYTNRGYIYGIQMEYDKALHDFDSALAIDPGNAEAHFNKGYVLSLVMKYPEAIRSFSEAIKIRAEDPPAYFYRGQARYYTGDRKAALEDFRKSAESGYQPAAEMIKAITGNQ